MEKIKLSKIWAEVVRLANTYPDAKYDNSGGCLYKKGKVTNGPTSEGCIIGQAMTNCGVVYTEEHCVKPGRLVTSNSERIEIILGYGHFKDQIEFDSEAAKIGIENTQYWQDSGQHWGLAIHMDGGV